MKVGMNLLLWTTSVTEEHDSILAALKETGFDGVEVPVGQGEAADYERTRARLDQLGLEATGVVALNVENNPVSPDATVRQAAVDTLKQAAEQTAILGGKVLCGPFHSAYKEFTGQGPTADEKKWCAETLQRAAEEAGKSGVTLAVEFLNRFECYMMNTAADAREIIQMAGHPNLKMLYDTHHAHIEEKCVTTAITDSAAEIGHVHISENDRGTPGSGQVNWQDSFAALKKIDFGGWLVIESFSRSIPEFAAMIHIWRDFFPSEEEVYQDGHAFIRRMWQES